MNVRDPSSSIESGQPAAFDAAALATLTEYTNRIWDDEIVPALTDYIAIPAKSPMFDPDWEKNGYIDKVVRDAAAWVERQKIPNLKLELIRLPAVRR